MMKKTETDILEEQIKEKKKLPKEIKEKINQSVFVNLAIGIMVILYFIFVNLGYYNIAKEIFIVDIKVFSMCLIIMTVILFEKAYTKGNSQLGIYGIEMLVVALVTLFMQYIYFYEDDTFIKLYMQIPLAFAMYYVIKATIITVKIQKKYYSSLSDIKEIIKKEEKTTEEEITQNKDDFSNEKVEDKQKNVSKEKVKQDEKKKIDGKKKAKKQNNKLGEIKND